MDNDGDIVHGAREDRRNSEGREEIRRKSMHFRRVWERRAPLSL